MIDICLAVGFCPRYNHAGYAQVLEETTYDLINTNDATRIQYTIGDDVISQTKSDGAWNTDHWDWTVTDIEYLLYDGHGSTRQLADSTGTVAENYSYDGYGVMLGANANAADSAGTSMLYAGEQFDTDAQQYYLRARYYNPQSLHKYLYVHNNPVKLKNFLDSISLNVIDKILG